MDDPVPEQVIIEMRNTVFMNTDPQRRCYNGAFYSYEFVWGPWQTLEFTTEEGVEDRLKFWRELNDYAVSQRGRGAKSEFRIKKAGEEGNPFPGSDGSV